MSSNRVVYQNWIADLGRDPSLKPNPECTQGSAVSSGTGVDDPTVQKRRARIKEAVSRALGKLTENEREFVERYYFMGAGYRNIGEQSGRAIHRLEALHQRALKKLRKELAPLVHDLYDITEPEHRNCPICSSSRRWEIDQLIAQRDPVETWRPVMAKIREDFGVDVVTPQTLIGHEKYH